MYVCAFFLLMFNVPCSRGNSNTMECLFLNRWPAQMIPSSTVHLLWTSAAALTRWVKVTEIIDNNNSNSIMIWPLYALNSLLVCPKKKPKINLEIMEHCRMCSDLSLQTLLNRFPYLWIESPLFSVMCLSEVANFFLFVCLDSWVLETVILASCKWCFYICL